MIQTFGTDKEGHPVLISRNPVFALEMIQTITLFLSK